MCFCVEGGHFAHGHTRCIRLAEHGARLRHRVRAQPHDQLHTRVQHNAESARRRSAALAVVHRVRTHCAGGLARAALPEARLPHPRLVLSLRAQVRLRGRPAAAQQTLRRSRRSAQRAARSPNQLEEVLRRPQLLSHASSGPQGLHQSRVRRQTQRFVSKICIIE